MAVQHKDIESLFQDHHVQTYLRFPLTIVKGKGTRVYDSEGKEYIDALAGIAVNNVGHCHPKVVKAIQEQAETLIHISNIYHNVPQAKLAQYLTEKSGLNRVFFCNSGLEANEGALKLARKYGEAQGKTGPVVSFTNCFHGRSIASITMGQEKYQKGFGPLPEGFEKLPYNDVEALESLDGNVKAVFVETIQGEGGVIEGDESFLKKVGQVCQEKNILLVLDEIQTGMGRTGKFLSYEHFGLKPDIVTIAKGLGSGMPIGAFLAREEVAKTLVPGDHGSTFAGNPMVCAAALATLEVLEEENLIEKTQETGSYLKNKLIQLADRYTYIKEVRGKGLMIGTVIDRPCRDLAYEMLKKGVLVSCTAVNVIRMVPPLTITKEECDTIVDVFEQAINDFIKKD